MLISSVAYVLPPGGRLGEPATSSQAGGRQARARKWS